MDKLDKKIRYLKRTSLINGLFTIVIALLSELMTTLVGLPFFLEMVQCPIWYESLAGTVLVLLCFLPDHTIRKNRTIGLVYALVSLLAGIFSVLVFLFICAPSAKAVFGIIYLVLYIIPFVVISGLVIAVLTDKTEVLPEPVYKGRRRLIANGAAAALVILGLGITCHAAIRFEQPEDLTKWQQCELGNTGVSVLMPDDRKETAPNMLPGMKQIVTGSGNRLIVIMSEFGKDEKDEQQDPEDSIRKIMSEETYTKDGIEYTKIIEKWINQKDTMITYMTSITFEYNGSIYFVGIMSGRIHSSLKRDINRILDTLTVDQSVRQS